MAQIFSNVAARAALEALVDTGQPLATVRLHLYADDLALSANMALATLTAVEANFDGYSSFSPLVWGLAETPVGGGAVITSVSHQFSCTGVTTPNVIYGYYLTTGTGDTLALIAMERVDEPLAMNGVGDAIIALVKIAFPGFISSLLFKP